MPGYGLYNTLPLTKVLIGVHVSDTYLLETFQLYTHAQQ